MFYFLFLVGFFTRSTSLLINSNHVSVTIFWKENELQLNIFSLEWHRFWPSFSLCPNQPFYLERRVFSPSLLLVFNTPLAIIPEYKYNVDIFVFFHAVSILIFPKFFFICTKMNIAIVLYIPYFRYTFCEITDLGD